MALFVSTAGAMTLSISSRTLVISSVQPGERIAWIAFVHEPQPYMWRDATEEGIAAVASDATSVTVPLQHAIDRDAGVLALSLTTGEIATTLPNTSRFREVAPPAFGISAASGAPATIHSARPDADILLVRPGAGAWGWVDGETPPRAVAAADAIPAVLAARDIIVAVDFRRLEYTTVTVGN
jgi:hypothetical protein